MFAVCLVGCVVWIGESLFRYVAVGLFILFVWMSGGWFVCSDDGWAGGYKDGRMGRWTDGSVSTGWMDGRMDG